MNDHVVRRAGGLRLQHVTDLLRPAMRWARRLLIIISVPRVAYHEPAVFRHRIKTFAICQAHPERAKEVIRVGLTDCLTHGICLIAACDLGNAHGATKIRPWRDLRYTTSLQ